MEKTNNYPGVTQKKRNNVELKRTEVILLGYGIESLRDPIARHWARQYIKALNTLKLLNTGGS